MGSVRCKGVRGEAMDKAVDTLLAEIKGGKSTVGHHEGVEQ
jgi:hypothetical protein